MTINLAAVSLTLYGAAGVCALIGWWASRPRKARP